MSQLAQQLSNRVLTLEIRLYACLARLQAGTDDEALHDLRITLRTLRSVLRPLRTNQVSAELQQAAAALGRLSGPLRDEQVLLAELQRLGQQRGLVARRSKLRLGLKQLMVSPELACLLTELKAFAASWRMSARLGELLKLRSTVRKGLQADKRRLLTMLNGPQLDWHRLRVRLKRLRYADESFAELAVLSRAQRKRLRLLQSALGDWHDRLQWLAQSEHDRALAPYVAHWQDQLAIAVQAVEKHLAQLQGAE